MRIGTVREKFPTDPAQPDIPEPKGEDYRVNPTNPPDPAAPVTNVKES